MKITPVVQNNICISHSDKSFLLSSDEKVSFSSAAPIYKGEYSVPQNYFHLIPSKRAKAEKYLFERTRELQIANKNYTIFDFDLSKLEGIQSGIKAFDGLSIPQIVFLTSNLTEVAVLRGCYNNCAHCYADAHSPVKNSKSEISRMSYEDFESLTSAIEELNRRIGFKISKNGGTNYNTLFHDADSSQIYTKDSRGRVHNWAEMAKMLYSATGKKVLFDTSGWYIQDKNAQSRMEEFVNDISQKRYIDCVDSINISANPFHSVHVKAVENSAKGNVDSEMKLRRIDAKRMANVLFTLTPLLRTKKIEFISRCLDPELENSEDFSTDELYKMWDETFFELEQLYIKDYLGERKVITSEKALYRSIQKFEDLFYRRDISFSVSPSVKLNKLNEKYDIESQDEAWHLMYRNSPEKALKSGEYGVMVDSNGSVYFTNWVETYPTDIKLNFSNKNKKTAPISPYLQDKIVDKEMLKTFYELRCNDENK